MTAPLAPQPLTAAQAAQLGSVPALLRARDVSGALAIALRIAAQATRSPDAQHLLGVCLAESGNADEAEKAFRRALDLAPGHALILLNFAAALRKAGRHADAVPLLQRAVQAAPGLAKAWLELGLVTLHLGAHETALAALTRAIEEQPGVALAWHALGNAHRADGQLESAEAALRQALALDPADAPAWINLGATQRLLGRPDDAIASFERARQAGYTAPDLDDALAGAWLDLGRADEGLALAQRLTHQHPDFVAGHVTLAHLLWEYGAALAPDVDAVALFRDSVAKRPHDRGLRLEFARFLLAARRFDDARAQIVALRAQGDDPGLIALEADALESIGRADQAGVLYAQAHRLLGGADAAFLNTYARHLLKARKVDLAARIASDALRIDPVNQEAWAYLGTAWRMAGDARESWLCDYERLVALVEVEPPPDFAGQGPYLDALRAALEPLHRAGREPVQQSLRGGSQTPGRLFGRKDPVIESARMALLGAIEDWLATLPHDDTHPFLRRKARSVRFSGSWSVKLWSSGRHVNHIHPEGWMSSAYYVALPPSVGAPGSEAPHAGCIQFGQPPVELGLGLPPRRMIRPEPGKLALFPSYLWHGTVPFADQQPRVTIAFDMVPRKD